jgi:hypothetical protein
MAVRANVSSVRAPVNLFLDVREKIGIKCTDLPQALTNTLCEDHSASVLHFVRNNFYRIEHRQVFLTNAQYLLRVQITLDPKFF